jgi:class III poly(R)-hydroxyalkanoic acid synthase PhaE subunit
MTDQSSPNTFGFSPWADFWINTQRRYWDSWMDTSRRAYGNPTATAEAPENPWLRTWNLWFGLTAPTEANGRRTASRADEPANPASAFGPWADFWLKAQRGYWENWLDASQQFLGAGIRRAEPPIETDLWSRLLDFWTSLILPIAPEQSRDWVRGVLETNRFYIRMGEGVWKMLAGSYGASQGAAHPWDAFGQGLRQMQENFTASLGANRNPWAGFANFWGMPLDNWRRVCSAFSMLPGDMEKAARGYGSPYGPETLHQTMVGVLSMPTVGYTREWQEELQRWGLLWLEHSRSLQAYGAVLVRITQRAFELFGRAVAEQAGQTEALGSLRGFYNLWIDCSEEAYAEISVSPEFIDAQAQLTNSLFAIKRQEQKMMEEVQAAFNMPTRRELDTSHRRVHQLQRRLWQVEQALEEAGGTELRGEVSALRRELEALRASLDAVGAKPAIPRKGGGLKTTT